MGEQATPEIEALMAAFYTAFDNRGSRRPAAEDLKGMLAEAATITRVAPDKVETWTPEAFISPRVEMLTDGTLTDFHEWETEAQTVVLENIACRRSTYGKAGKLNGADYQGGGHKFIQFHRTEGRWLISSILWEDTT